MKHKQNTVTATDINPAYAESSLMQWIAVGFAVVIILITVFFD